MNAQRLRAVADAILSEEKGKTLPYFNMIRFAIDAERLREPWKPFMIIEGLAEVSCNSCCCIAGMACFLFGDRTQEHTSWEKEGARILGLTEVEMDDLFYSHWTETPMEEITPAEAAAHLYALADQAELNQLTKEVSQYVSVE